MNKIGETLIHAGANKELIRSFLSNGVEFVVVGGLAVAWYCTDRRAEDMDLLVNPTAENSARISRTLDRLRIHGHTDKSFIKPGLQVPLKQNYYAELLTPDKDGPAYAEIAADAVEGKLFNISVRIASVASLIRLKERAVKSAEAQRDKHLQDIERLKRHSP